MIDTLEERRAYMVSQRCVSLDHDILHFKQPTSGRSILFHLCPQELLTEDSNYAGVIHNGICDLCEKEIERIRTYRTMGKLYQWSRG